MNVKLRLIIKNNQSRIEQLDPETQMWLNLPKAQTLQWQNNQKFKGN